MVAGYCRAWHGRLPTDGVRRHVCLLERRVNLHPLLGGRVPLQQRTATYEGGEHLFCHATDADYEMADGDHVEFAVKYSSAKGKDKAVEARRVAQTAAVTTSTEDEEEYDASNMGY